ncbi:hypothetical protein HC635_24975 [Escherichia coli]|uniref:hypothetical protein n=1 Tax=Escherichia coli TaxID=562 RepID=UPI0010CCA6C0|nr:hypothetical protein [Escherichia coli]NPR73970.1 hypothetical protein [Escherichia coli]GDH12282.1 hypothetical protein BvCmsKKNP019_04100 [Escherichia coli]HAX4891093.1 hypothetical protein [Escherichia coli]HBD2241242.1 hypothetical protein [Escherichia coli]HBH7786396.1 hypothetical protein [Escherichia coli]
MIELLILAVVLLYLAGVILMGAFQQAVDSDGVIWFELVFWPFITMYAFTAAMRDNIMRAIKERKNGK